MKALLAFFRQVLCAVEDVIGPRGFRTKVVVGGDVYHLPESQSIGEAYSAMIAFVTEVWKVQATGAITDPNGGIILFWSNIDGELED